MLSQETLEWLESRKNICPRCSKREYCRTGKRHGYNTTECRFWDQGVLLPKHIYISSVREDWRDAARFEALVSQLLGHPEWEPDPKDIEEAKSDHPRLEIARIKAEQFMDGR